MTTPNILDITGTSSTTFQLGIQGSVIKNNSGPVVFQNAAGSANVGATALTLSASATAAQLVLNSAATGSGSSWTTTIQNAQSGQTAALTFTLPANAGSAGQVLQTDGTGVTSWVSAASTAACTNNIVHTVNYSDTSPYAYFTLPANAVVESISVNVITAFNGTSPSLSVGVSGTTSKFMPATSSDLTTVGGYEAINCQYVATSTSTQSLLITFAAGTGATAGQAKVSLAYSVPTAV